MDFAFFFFFFIKDLMLGLTYVLIASGFSLIYGIMRLLNFAHGEFYMLGAFATYLLSEHLGLDYFTALILSMIIIAVLGMLVYRFFFRPFRDQHDPSLVIALGIAMLIGGLALLIFGEKDKSVSPVFSGVIQILGATLSVERMVVIFSAILLMTALTLFIKFSKTGQAMRAVAQDREAAALQGSGFHLYALYGHQFRSGRCCRRASGSSFFRQPFPGNARRTQGPGGRGHRRIGEYSRGDRRRSPLRVCGKLWQHLFGRHYRDVGFCHGYACSPLPAPGSLRTWLK